jgi:hypothetical protein
MNDPEAEVPIFEIWGCIISNTRRFAALENFSTNADISNVYKLS